MNKMGRFLLQQNVLFCFLLFAMCRLMPAELTKHYHRDRGSSQGTAASTCRWSWWRFLGGAHPHWKTGQRCKQIKPAPMSVMHPVNLRWSRWCLSLRWQQSVQVFFHQRVLPLSSTPFSVLHRVRSPLSLIWAIASSMRLWCVHTCTPVS